MECFVISATVKQKFLYQTKALMTLFQKPMSWPNLTQVTILKPILPTPYVIMTSELSWVAREYVLKFLKACLVYYLFSLSKCLFYFFWMYWEIVIKLNCCKCWALEKKWLLLELSWGTPVCPQQNLVFHLSGSVWCDLAH